MDKGRRQMMDLRDLRDQPPPNHGPVRVTNANDTPPAVPVSQGFFSALFDGSFTTLVTPRLVRFVYRAMIVLAIMLGIGGFALGLVGIGKLDNAWIGVALAVGSPIVAFFWLLNARVALEFVLVAFRIVELLERPSS
jgi:hypothetical protein